MRGKALQRCAVLGSLRITPAYAGKSYTDDMKHYTEQDHPRLCGEKCGAIRWWACRTGSPPPMRGKGKPLSGAALQVRITPAYAGKSTLHEVSAPDG